MGGVRYMKKLLVLLVILSFFIVGCEKQAEPSNAATTGGESQQETAPAAQPAATQNPAETNQADSDQKLLNKIDWNSIEDGAILIQANQFGAVEYVGAGSDQGWRIFVPDKNDFLDFINNYDFELTTLEENGKTVYRLKEIKRKPAPVTNGLSLLPQDVQGAFGNLLANYPNFLSSGNGVSSSGIGGAGPS